MEKSLGVSQKKLLLISGTGWMFDALDVGILSFVIAALAKDWNLNPSEMGWIGSINSIGMAVGALLFGILADKFGRKAIFMITLLFFSIGSGLSALAPTLGIFLILRFLIGMGLGGELPVASTLVSESVPTKDRGRVVVLLESFWAGGWLIAALISYFIIPHFGWKIALLICTIPAFYAIYLRLSLPDSPRFQLTNQAKHQSVITKMKQVWSKKYAKRTLMLWVVWFTVVFSYYGMFLWLPSVMVLKGFSLIKSFEYVLIMTLAQLPGYFTAAWLIEKVGRKFVLVTFLLGTAVFAYLFGNGDSLTMLMVSGMFLSFFNLGAWGALYAYSPEQYPTIFRGTGTGMAAAFGRVGGIFGPLLVGNLVAEKVSTDFIFTIFCISIIIGVLFVMFLGKETKQLELE
ncbi:MFS transporter [Heyndrickxia camelliae]|uniref:MFS transporter n=1 Tax=Heyndrickxia camelliae TaxID=1707093 RepID=A0A2N3LLW5_9BACI|nr:MFS transporter [Heyndrickxia camelliae]PKR85544.1 MFS transporter [Heyndrickxia camelliae]